MNHGWTQINTDGLQKVDSGNKLAAKRHKRRKKINPET